MYQQLELNIGSSFFKREMATVQQAQELHHADRKGTAEIVIAAEKTAKQIGYNAHFFSLDAGPIIPRMPRIV